VTLQPGESAEIGVPLPAEVAEAVAQGARLCFAHGPIVETSPNNYERMVGLVLDGEPRGTFVLAWHSEPPKEWYRRVWNRLRWWRPAGAELRMETGKWRESSVQ
jgi:hypothetical protein